MRREKWRLPPRHYLQVTCKRPMLLLIPLEQTGLRPSAHLRLFFPLEYTSRIKRRGNLHSFALHIHNTSSLNTTQRHIHTLTPEQRDVSVHILALSDLDYARRHRKDWGEIFLAFFLLHCEFCGTEWRWLEWDWGTNPKTGLCPIGHDSCCILSSLGPPPGRWHHCQHPGPPPALCSMPGTHAVLPLETYQGL